MAESLQVRFALLDIHITSKPRPTAALETLARMLAACAVRSIHTTRRPPTLSLRSRFDGRAKVYLLTELPDPRGLLEVTKPGTLMRPRHALESFLVPHNWPGKNFREGGDWIGCPPSQASPTVVEEAKHSTACCANVFLGCYVFV